MWQFISGLFLGVKIGVLIISLFRINEKEKKNDRK